MIAEKNARVTPPVEKAIRPGDDQTLVEVTDLVKHFPVRRGLFRKPLRWVPAVDGVSFFVRKGETLALVGESGCGKTTTGLCTLRLLEPTAGRVRFDGLDLLQVERREIKAMRREMQMIFEDPYSALDPSMTAAEAVGEGLRIHSIGTPKQREEMALEMLRRVGLAERQAEHYPKEFSGGQRQRIGIARALALRPKFIVADEPVSALDVSVQAQILNLLADLQDELGLTYLLIAHNLRVVEHIADRVMVMYLGRIVESAGREALFEDALHPYTQKLIAALPAPGKRRQGGLVQPVQDVSSLLEPPPGCRFHPRCEQALGTCAVEVPPLLEVAPGHWVACWRVREER
jgi:oligopeptide/dipeptide ABC transporter ATP-binding protein